LYVN